MGTKHTKPILDVHTVQQRLPRGELLYLKNLFIFLCHHASASSASSAASAPAPAAASAASVPPAQLNQSQSSAALASPSNLELMSLRLPRALVLRHLLSPSFPSLSPAMLERCYAIFDYHSYGSGGMDYSEYLVMMYTLWHCNPHDELARFLFVLCDPGQSGRVAAKHYRRVATALWTDQAAYCAAKDAAGGTAATGAAFLGLTSAAASKSADPTGKGGVAEREWLTSMFDFYFLLACFHYDRDHDNVLNLNEFGNFACDDLLLSSFLSRQTDARQMKQRLHQQLGVTAATLAAMDGAGGGAGGAAQQSASLAAAMPPSMPLTSRNFLGEPELEESSGAIWRAQRRSTLKIAARRASLGAQQTSAAATQAYAAAAQGQAMR